ncbi:prepilin-type cleavage/methylation domain-containing protein [Limnohabitans sp. TS-CS-82]|uniref:type IV pilin protein n=1 Tax=Limnohabitans sp. TS-CS-82 TaxID=2094193 RepID=UPI000CF22F78|nr:type IV pilin protein [Limnohabitans sp. TS-CS-82]PQA80430.1 prepilin-type cleavage/methylation domain-containing protein [Limnohabitans sp. TS-CS-82]
MTHAHRQHGFTLIELLIALACVALLASLAWPSYQSLILRSQRAQARASLLQAAHWFERAASANGSYPSAADVPASVLQVEGQRYKMTVASSTQSYTLSATPQGTQAADSCGVLTVNHLGVRSVQGASQTAAQCWSR